MICDVAVAHHQGTVGPARNEPEIVCHRGSAAQLILEGRPRKAHHRHQQRGLSIEGPALVLTESAIRFTFEYMLTNFSALSLG